MDIALTWSQRAWIPALILLLCKLCQVIFPFLACLLADDGEEKTNYCIWLLRKANEKLPVTSINYKGLYEHKALAYTKEYEYFVARTGLFVG